ncbi:beta-aspartyl-peptidase [Endozoicomonas ascidiicola]|uniref:beta-aspartyl-peptidase n=1 Tax=Endozoicomonas ascidiicola TaxID=1698521 RepID=UPI00082FB4DA|nr:beta-aspartyl-peptidase [Endozoicomonas ascidiicola]
MFLLIKNAELYTPEYLGKKDLLICSGKIVAIEDQIDRLANVECRVLNLDGSIVGPGLIDQHVHLIGGGGEGGYATRVPQLMFSDLVKAGLTSVVGILGTDGITRSPKDLYAKVKALEIEGLNAFMHTGSYEVPTRTITGSIRDDMVYVDKVLGVKVALADHRCSFPSTEVLAQMVSDIRIGGMVSGKKGILHIHMGDLPNPMAQINQLTAMGLPIHHFSPTHINRNEAIFEEAIDFAKRGGHIDLTSGGSWLENIAPRIRHALSNGVPLSQMTISSDGNGSMPKFNEKGEMVGVTAANVDSNLKSIPNLLDADLNMTNIFSLLSTNVADSVGLAKGRIAVGCDADFTAFSHSALSRHDVELSHVISRGQVLMSEGEILVQGTFE